MMDALSFVQWLAQASEPLVAVLLDAAFKGVLILAIACLIALLMRKSSASARHLVWLFAAVSLLLLPMLSLILPGWGMLPQWGLLQQPRSPMELLSAVEVSPPPAPQFPIEHAPSLKTAPPVKPHINLTIAAAIPTPAKPWPEMPPALWLLLVWLTGSAIAVAPLALGAWSLRRLRHRCSRINDAAWQILLARAAHDLGLTRRVKLLHTDGRAMPMTWGILRPTVLLPAECHDWPIERRRAVLLHELAHVRRWDCLWQLLIHLACAAHWFNPLAWVARAKAQSEREQACDDRVLSCGTKQTEYAEQVLHVASALRARMLTSAAAIAMARPSQLEGRLRAILDSKAQVRFGGGDDAWLTLHGPKAVRTAQLKLVDDPEAGAVAMRLDYKIGATGEKRSEVIAKLESRKPGELILSVLPAAAAVSENYVPVAGMQLRRADD